MPAESDSSACIFKLQATVDDAAPACRDDDPATVWAALAPLVAGRPRVRISRDGGKNYHARWERNLDSRLPTMPAAVPLYSGAGDTRCLVIDLDTAKGGREVVLADAAAITRLIADCGGSVITDESASGGVHVYVPLAEPVSFHEARDMALALAARTPSMDPTPNTNLLSGLIRPPGSPHKRGGHQTLRGSLATAHRIATERNPATVWRSLTAVLADDIADVTKRRADHAGPDDTDCVPRPGGPRELTADYLRIATTGVYDTARYPSPSEARQAVVTSAVWAGMTLPRLAGRIESGAWPGLAAFYARYAPHSRAKALASDWRKAVGLVTQKRQEQQRGSDAVQKSPTSGPNSHRRAPRVPGRSNRPDYENSRGTAGEYQFLRGWWTALSLVEKDRYPGRGGLARRMVLRALGEAGMKTGSRFVAFGTRSMALATGLDHTTVAVHLRELRGEPDPLVALVENDRGLQGDLYELTVPVRVAERVETLDWRGGRIHALRPAFRELGLPAAYVYEALERAHEALTSFELVDVVGLSRSSVYAALETLGAYNLAEKRHGKWRVVASTCLRIVAEQLGCLDDVDDQLARYRVERSAYRAALGVIVPFDEQSPTMLDEWATGPPPAPPDDVGITVIDLLQQRLGAHPIESSGKAS